MESLINPSTSSLRQFTDEAIQKLYRTIDDKDKLIDKLRSQNASLQQKINKIQESHHHLLKKNNELRDINANIVNIYQEYVINVGSQISEDQNKKNLREKCLMGLDLQKMRINLDQKQQSFQKKVNSLKQSILDSKDEAQMAIDVMNAQKRALEREVQSYNQLIIEKTFLIDNHFNNFKEIQKILQIDSKNIDFALIKGKIVQILNENRRFELILKQKDKNLTQMIEEVTQAMKQSWKN